jgi:spore maturation protein A
MNAIWIALIGLGVVFAIATGNLGPYTQALFDGARAAVEICLFLLGIVALWLGLARILEEAGLIARLSRLFRPLVARVFRGVPGDHPAIASITLNLLANLFGLGNAATPLGIKAMQDLRTLNPDGDTVDFNSMLFLVLNTASIQLVPFTVMGVLATAGSANPAWVVLPVLLATLLSALVAVGLLFLARRISR